MKFLLEIFLFVLGACLGSFLCCQARRLHLKSKKRKSPGDHSLGPRSVCLHCGRQLAWYENIPLVSWVFLRGRCRTCHARIGIAEPLSELGLAVALTLVGLPFDPVAADPLAWASFIVTLALTLSLDFLAIYDGLYGELPSFCLTISIICAIMLVILRQWSFFLNGTFTPVSLLYLLGSVALLGGVYLVLYVVSHGKWVGDGDWLLGLALGLALGRPWLALITLFLTNFLACLVMLPVRTRRVHLGPFFVAAFLITYAFADFFCQIEPSML